MKRVMLTVIAALLVSTSYAQFTLGPKVGLSASKIELDHLTIDGQTLSSGNATAGFHAGAFARITLGGLYIQPEALFTQTGGKVELDNGVFKDIRELEFNKLDIPVMVGTKFAGIFRLQAGPTISILLDAEAEGLDQEIESGYEDATIGYQAGVGVDLWNLVVDVKYEGNLSTFGNELFGFETDQRNNQWIVSVGFKLF